MFLYIMNNFGREREKEREREKMEKERENDREGVNFVFLV